MSRPARWLRSPLKHAWGLSQAYVFNRFFGSSARMDCRLFTGDRFSVILPAGLDLYLIGIKSHDSEIRLTRYLLGMDHHDHTLALDCGAHLGYYTMVMSHIFKSVISFEPTPDIYNLLESNTDNSPTVRTENAVVADHDGTLDFVCLPTRYSESSTLQPSTVPAELQAKARIIPVKAYTIDSFCAREALKPSFIKIDVEGSEAAVLRGGKDTLQSCRPTLAMSFA